MELPGRSALVTGGAGGLGAATVRHLVSLGMDVAIFDRNLEGATALSAEIGAGTTAVGGDINDDDDVASAIGATQSMSPMALLVNIAGGGVRSQRTVSRDGSPHDKDAFVYTMAINALGTFNVSRLVAAAMASNEPDADGQRGVIVNTSSLAGLEGQAGQLAYAAAKAAIAGMTLPMARDLAPLGIRVCAIAPGTMLTPVFESAPEELKQRLTNDIVFPKRMGRPVEFALAVEMVLRNSYLNGEIIRLDAALRFPPK
jgi:NAD(P)-dependent dehydrogenase (short-subunit alcohol dehydrogenase family)